MESPKPCRPSPNPLLSLSAFIHQNCLRFGAELAGRIEETKRFAGALAGNLPAVVNQRLPFSLPSPPFASLTQPKPASAAAAAAAAAALKAADLKNGFNGVPVFQSDLLVVKKKNKRYCPIYFTKEDIENELGKVSRASRGPGVSQNILVGSLEDVLRKMEVSEKDSGWEDLIFIPPGKSFSQHIQDVSKK
ncbi:protein TIC 22, chloroplastic [Morus notabilis]|uniref:protein TIC 22, chloroplastic n=1 Tax=Morus notabilis TaxID=981085 RepID=UPI000CED52C2|nr:protein TIC 22, chloroplastic [Morus notabilis]